MFKQKQQSLSQWYHSQNWDRHLATFVVTWAFSMLGAAASDYFSIMKSIRTATILTSPSWVGSAVISLYLGFVAALIFTIAYGISSRYIDRLDPLAGAIVIPTGIGIALSYLLFVGGRFPRVDLVTLLEFTVEDVLPPLVYWSIPSLSAAFGTWVRKNRPSLPNAAVPKAFTVVLLLLVVSGSVAGLVGSTEMADDETDGIPEKSPYNYSAYSDGDAGPEIPLNATRTDAVPLEDSTLACSEPVKNGSYHYGRTAVNKLIPASEERAVDRISIQRYRFGNGTIIPNRAMLVVDVPRNTTHLRTDIGPNVVDFYDPEDETSLGPSYAIIDGEHTLRFSTEWSQDGAAAVTFAYENGTNHRYYAGICPTTGGDD